MSEHAFGWVNLPAESERIVASLPMPVFADAAPFLRDSGEGKDVFFWEAEQQILNKVLPSWNQGGVGSCVSFGWGRGVQDLLLCEIASGELEEWPGAEVATEPIYGGSRVEIGGGRISGDGSVGAWAADYVAKYGILFRQKYGSHDLSVYSESKCREYGRRGVPDDLEPIAREHPVKTVSLCASANEARDALANLYPVPVCSNQGFSSTRDANGVCRAQGSWAHCMTLRGYGTLKGGRPIFVIQNSWGDYVHGPDVLRLESGKEVKLPMGCFGAEFDVVDRMLRGRDSFAISGFVGFKARNIPWIFT